jgi:hypothetical protein
MTKLTLLGATSALMIAASALAPALGQAAQSSAAAVSSPAATKLQYAGALTFSPDGVLFAGDNISGAVFAYQMDAGAAAAAAAPLDVEGIDGRIAALLKTPNPAFASTAWRSIPSPTMSICRFRSAVEAQPW